MTYFNNKKDPKDNGPAYCLQSYGRVTIISGADFTMACFPLIVCSHVSVVEACAQAGRGQRHWIPAFVMQGVVSHQDR